MDDSCAVCADVLEWVAYGPCGHRDVCSTCVTRLRFICDDRRCCICKSESDVVFVTKALGDYTRTISDFSVLPSQPREGRMGSYWFHEDTQAFFDDVDHYKMIKAMCRLSCSVCDKMEEQPNDGSKRQVRFRNIEQLKGHLFHRHKLLMCSLCLEGRKVFICEQKLYDRPQLNQHISTGDSEVDGSEGERGGFAGHPACEFCRTPFYGDNELYLHMSTEHFTCHICQRLHPGQYEYYRNYDDLEIHFRHDHFLCEDEACLGKKFIVFQSEVEMKRHNTIEHGGRLSRSKRNAALQIPTSFRYRRGNDQDHQRGGRTFRRDPSDSQLSMAIQASLDTANSEGSLNDPLASSLGGQVDSESHVDLLIQPIESINIDLESASRYRQALGHNARDATLAEASFPPLSTAPSSSHPNAKQDSDTSANSTMAAHLRRQRKVNVVNSAQGWPVARHGQSFPSNNSAEAWPAINSTHAASHSSEAPKIGISRGPSSSSSSLAQVQAGPRIVRGLPASGSSGGSGSKSRISHSASAPCLSEKEFVDRSVIDFPPVSSAQTRKVPTISQSLVNVEDVQTANKSLVEKIRTALENDPDRYNIFKDISGQYRQGLIDTEIYLDFVQQFGLSHLVIELARLCPDVQKQKELIDMYSSRLQSVGTRENGRSREITDHSKEKKGAKKGKGKGIDDADYNPKDALADSVISSVRKLQANLRPSEMEAEVLSKDGYRASTKEKSKEISDEHKMVLRSKDEFPPATSGSKPNTGDAIGGSKHRKKTSKFHRVRLGDGSDFSHLDFKNSPDQEIGNLYSKKEPDGALAVRGVWKNSGGHKLFP